MRNALFHRITVHQQKLVQYNGVSSLHSDTKVIEILKKNLLLLCNDQCESVPPLLSKN